MSIKSLFTCANLECGEKCLTPSSNLPIGWIEISLAQQGEEGAGNLYVDILCSKMCLQKWIRDFVDVKSLTDSIEVSGE